MPDINDTIKPSASPSAELRTEAPLSTGPSTELSAGSSSVLTPLSAEVGLKTETPLEMSGATMPSQSVAKTDQSIPGQSGMKEAWNDFDKTKASLQSSITGSPLKDANVDIYAMPKEFQKHNTVAGGNSSVGMFVMLGSLILLLIAGSGAVLYYLKPELLTKITGVEMAKTEPVQSPVVVNEAPVVPVVSVVSSTPEVVTSTEAMIATSTPPGDIYLAYNIDLGKINTFADYFALINKYGSAHRIEQLEAEKLLADASADKGVATVATVKKAIPILDPLAKINPSINGETATLEINLTDNVSKGTVDMLWQSGSWKLDNENWVLPAQSEQIAYVAGIDRDGDGLTDKEEDLFGSNKESSDSDADGYSDAVEVSGLYDPNKKAAKLVDSGKFSTYLSEDGGYSIMRPSEWAQSTDMTENSVSFRATDDHYVKITSVENYNNESLDALYTKQFKVTQIDGSLRLEDDSWLGIMAPDGMSAYLVSKLAKNKYYIINYSIPVRTQELEYKEVFLTMIKSLVLKK